MLTVLRRALAKQTRQLVAGGTDDDRLLGRTLQMVQRQTFGVGAGRQQQLIARLQQLQLVAVIGRRGAGAAAVASWPAQRQQHEQLKAWAQLQHQRAAARCSNGCRNRLVRLVHPGTSGASGGRRGFWLRYPPAVSLLPVWHRQTAPDRAKRQRVSAGSRSPAAESRRGRRYGRAQAIVALHRPAAADSDRPAAARIVLRQRHLQHQIVPSILHFIHPFLSFWFGV